MTGRYQTYSEYKESGVEWLGKVPVHWDISRLGKHFDERREKVDDVEYPPLSVTKNGVVPQLETAAKSDASDNRKRVASGDFVINSRSDRKGSSGTSALSGSVSLIYTVLSPIHTDASFVHHLFRSYPFQEEFYRYGKGIVADLWSTNYSEMKNINLALPEFKEQHQIARFLDHETTRIDQLIAKQERLIELLKEKRQAVISHAVTKGLDPDAPMKDSGIEGLGVVSADWKAVRIMHASAILDCKHLTAEFVDHGIPLASIKEVQSWFVDLSRAKKTTPAFVARLVEGNRNPRPGDIIYSRNATVGEAALVSEEHPEFAMGQDVCLIRSEVEIHPKFLMYHFRSGHMRNQLDCAMVGATFKRVNVEDITNFWITLPSKAEQKQITDYLDSRLCMFDKLMSDAKRIIVLLQERRTALISAAVTGKIDVRNWELPTTNDKDAA